MRPVRAGSVTYHTFMANHTRYHIWITLDARPDATRIFQPGIALLHNLQLCSFNVLIRM